MDELKEKQRRTEEILKRTVEELQETKLELKQEVKSK
jgi:hypothetical protein